MEIHTGVTDTGRNSLQSQDRNQAAVSSQYLGLGTHVSQTLLHAMRPVSSTQLPKTACEPGRGSHNEKAGPPFSHSRMTASTIYMPVLLLFLP